MDISNLGVVDASERGTEMPLVNPFNTQELLGHIEIIGFDSEKVLEASRDFDLWLARQRPRPPQDEIDRLRRARQCFAAVKDWKEITLKGETPTLADLEDPNFVWLSEQIWVYGSNRRNFSKPTLKGSASGQNTSDSSTDPGKKR